MVKRTGAVLLGQTNGEWLSKDPGLAFYLLAGYWKDKVSDEVLNEARTVYKRAKRAAGRKHQTTE